MFDGALGKAPGSRGRVWLGAVISVGAHAAVLCAALFITTGNEPAEVTESDFKYPVVIPMERVTQGSRDGTRAAAQPTPKKKPRPEAKAPVAVSRPVEVEPPPAPEDNVADSLEPVTGGAITGLEGIPLGDPKGSCEGPGCIDRVPDGAVVGDQVMNFDQRMTPPVLLSGDSPEYTREALESRVQGTMVVRCVVELSGELENCRVIKPLPHMEQEVLSSLATRRYKPVTLDGQPIPVSYVFTIRLQLPR